MKDARFLSHNEWRQQVARGRERARMDLSAFGDPDLLAAATAIALDGTDCERLLLCSYSPFDAIRPEVDRFSSGDPHISPASWYAITTALSMIACARPASAARMHRCYERLGRSPSWTFGLFFDRCASLIDNGAEASMEPWLKQFELPLALEPEAPLPESAVVHFHGRAERLVDDPFRLWEESNPAIQAVETHPSMTLLRRIDPDRWFRAVDSWSDPWVVDASLFGDHVRHDREALLHWLTIASPCFDQAGAWTGRVAAISLVEAVLHHGQALLDEFSQNRQTATEEQRAQWICALRKLELPVFFATAWEVLLARSDGLALAAAFHAYLSAPGGVSHHRGDRDAAPIARAALARALSRRTVRTREVERLFNVRLQLNRPGSNGYRPKHASGFNALLSAIEVIENGGPVDDDLLDMFSRLLTLSDWGALVRQGKFPGTLRRLAGALAGTTESLARVEALYTSLEPSRRRGEHGRAYLENDIDMPSTIVLHLMLTIINTAAESETAKLAAQRVLACSTRLLLTSSPSFEPTLAVRHAFAFAAATAALRSPPSLVEALRVALPDPILAAVATTAVLRVWPAAELEEVLATLGSSISVITAAVSEWTALSNDPHAAEAHRALVAATKSAAN